MDELSKARLSPGGERVVASIVAKLAVVYAASMRPDQLELLTAVWTEELAEFPADLLTAAYHHIVRTHKDGWFPKPAQMIEHMTEARTARIVAMRDAQPQRTPALRPPPPTEDEKAFALDAINRIRKNLAETTRVAAPTEPDQPRRTPAWNAKIPGFQRVPMPWEKPA